MPVMNSGLMRKAMQYAGMLGVTIISHSEKKAFRRRLVARRVYINNTWFKGYSRLCRRSDGWPGYHFSGRDRLPGAYRPCQHSRFGPRERGKARGVRVSAEAAPHHFTLTDEAVMGFDTFTKVNPPLRTGDDVAAVRQGLADGTIDVIATDHAPHTAEEKDVEYERAPFGMVGLETAVGLVWTELVNTGVLTPLQAITCMTLNPARILGIPKGTLETGADADITIIDPGLAGEVDPAIFASKGRNTPFTGRMLKGLPWLTIVSGRVVMHEGILEEENQ
jgi:dihydroorotase